ncbi:MAG TPA: HEAT repeat domain-containing protein [Phenylobacterium sp.]|jgi:HEAT repeat protein|uniref:HEAT repeat domain-containing protein n=1 Tax=Phenylobacterium sp. TaxID=1871053 RepID=UPI002D403024|nr:HEAT repeat domain-containing protein [Phenylobacterium sp.]HZZ70363.1 HEAT repeat domain-containing protein [Phenylobacterium sp.]
MPLIRKNAGQTPKAPVAQPPSSDLLTSGTDDERWSAARALADDPGGGDALSAALPQEPAARVREAILTGLIRHGGDAGVRAVVPQIRSDDAKLRTEALDALRAMPGVLEPYLRELLHDSDPDVRLLTCDLARVLPDADASRMLSELLDRETEANVCGAAIDALAEVGGPDALPALTRCAARFPDEPFLGFAIRAAAQAIGAAD